MNNNWIRLLEQQVKEQFMEYGADHDWYHIERVYKVAMHICVREKGNTEVVACGALLHDISDHKLNGGKLNDNGRVARLMLERLGVDEALIGEVEVLVDAVSFKGANVPDAAGSLELNIVRDADRLDAMGALGIARAFHFGGSRERPFYLPDVPPQMHDSFDAYHKSGGHTLNHFHEKLLLLKDRLVTPSAREIGEKRHRLMEEFVDAFYREWHFKG